MKKAKIKKRRGVWIVYTCRKEAERIFSALGLIPKAPDTNRGKGARE